MCICANDLNTSVVNVTARSRYSRLYCLGYRDIPLDRWTLNPEVLGSNPEGGRLSLFTGFLYSVYKYE